MLKTRQSKNVEDERRTGKGKNENPFNRRAQR
jgi:hypothetical protein